jgi:hypothetical protein
MGEGGGMFQTYSVKWSDKYHGGKLMGLNFYDASHISKNDAIKVKRLKF